MNKYLYVFGILPFLIFSYFPGKALAQETIIVAEDGTKYIVFKRQKMIFNGDKMFVVQYQSKNPKDEVIRMKEFDDIYSFIANNIDPKSDYKYIALEAVANPDAKFGISRNSGYRDRRLLSNVMSLRKQFLKQGQE